MEVFEVKRKDKESIIVELKNVDFDTMLQALSVVTDKQYSYLKAGKIIYDIKKSKDYPEIEEDNNLMSSLCLEICTNLVMPELSEVKKK